jgi:hypothetical protein
MPIQLTSSDRGVEAARPEPGQTGAGRDTRSTGSKTLEQEEQYARRRGPLMSMTANVERAMREQDQEREQRVRQGSARAGAAARLVHDLQQRKADGKHLGIGYGVEWLAKQAQKSSKDEKEQQAFARRKKQELDERGLTMMSCLTMHAISLRQYFEGTSMGMPKDERLKLGQRLDAAFAKAADARGTGKQEVFGGRGTVVLEEMRKGFGFETVHVDGVRDKTYWNHANYTSDEGTRRTGMVPNQAAPVVGADSKSPINVQVGIDRFVKLGKQMSPESRALWDSLKRVEYAVGVADSGYHTFVLTAGKVYEVHWDKGPTNPRLTEATDVDAFFKKWGSGVIAVPPGVLNAKPKPVETGEARHESR